MASWTDEQKKDMKSAARELHDAAYHLVNGELEEATGYIESAEKLLKPLRKASVG